MERVCSVADAECVPGRLKRGMCGKHYTRLRKHGTTQSPLVDNWSRYEQDSRGCWLWQGPLYRNGYGQLSRVINGTQLAHRAFFMRFKFPIPRSVDLDHLCRVRCCVNPDHLQPVTRRLNLTRGAGTYGARTLCKKGLHDITIASNIRIEGNGTRTCMACWRIRYRAAGKRYRERLKGLKQ